MKKKVALLLALVVALSLIPMNVFGVVATQGRVTPFVTRGEWAGQAFNLHFDAGRFVGHQVNTNPMFINLQIGGGAEDWQAAFLAAHSQIAGGGRIAGYGNFYGVVEEDAALNVHPRNVSPWNQAVRERWYPSWDPAAVEARPLEVTFTTGSAIANVFATNGWEISARMHFRAWNNAILELVVVEAGTGGPNVMGAPVDMQAAGIPAGIGGEIHVSGVMMRAASAGRATLTATWYGDATDPNPLINNFLFMNIPTQGITISASPINFQNVAFLDNIEIRENQLNALWHGYPNSTTVTLRAPRDYSFALGFGGQFGFSHFGIYTTGDMWAPADRNQNVIVGGIGAIRESWEDGIYHRLDIEIAPRNRAPQPLGLTPGRLQIRGLAMVPSQNARPSGNVYIDVGVGINQDGTPWNQAIRGTDVAVAQTPITVWSWEQWEVLQVEAGVATHGWVLRSAFSNPGPATSGVTDAGPNPINARRNVTSVVIGHHGGGTAATMGGNGIGRENFYVRGLHVATRTELALEMRVSGNVPTLPSGRFFGAPPTLETHNNPWYDQHNRAHEEIRTARIQIEEHSVGAFDSGVASSILDLSINQPGVQMLGARWRIMGLHDAPDLDEVVAANELLRNNSMRNWRRVDAPTNILAPPALQQHILPGSASIVNIGDDSIFRVAIPRTPVVPRRRTFEIEFALSVEAGFEWKHGEAIEVTAGGNAANLLADDNRTVTVANVADPLILSLDGPPIQIDAAGQVFNLIAPTDIPDIVITENRDGALRRGQELFVGIAAIPTGIIGHPVLHNSVTTVDSESGMRIEAVRTTRQDPTAPQGTGYITGIRITIVNESVNGPATITLTNNQIMGAILPGVDYVAFVTGPNTSDERVNRVSQNTWRGMHDTAGFFDALAYYTRVVEILEDATPPGFAPPPGGTQPGEFARQSFTANTIVNVGGYDIQAVAFPLVAPGIVSSMMNPRVFADFVGASMDWDDAARTATFSGYSRQGEYQHVVLTLDSPTIQVNGVPHDIATLAGQPMLAGNVNPVVYAGRQFVPARVLANIFGVPIDFAAGTVILG